MNPFKKTILQEWRKKFWTDLNIKYKDLGFNFKAVKPYDRPYYYMSTEVPYLIFTNRVNKRKGICKVEFYTEVERAEDLYEALVKYKEEIYSQLSFPLVWNPPCEKHRYFAVGAIRENFDFKDDKDQVLALDWLSETGIQLFNTLYPYFKKIK